MSLADESDEEGEACGMVAEKSELEVVHSWLEVGGFLVLDGKKVQGLLCEVLVHYHSTFLTMLLLFHS